MSDHATLRDAILYFADFDHCKDFMVQLRWPDAKVTCPRCGGERLCWVEKQRLWKCYDGHKQPTFTLKTGTIFEDSPIALEKWLPATWLLLNCKNGISSYEIARDLGVTQKTAWFMLGRIRLAMQDEETGGKLGGPGIEVEADETFVGGAARFMHPARRNKMREPGNFGKTIVSAVLERHGKVRATVVPNRRKKAIQAHLRDHVEPGSTVYSDELLSYDGLDEYKHRVINHAETYVNGQVHTNGMENFWSLLKRGLKGTYIAVEPFHLFRYVDEQAFRFNNRETDDIHRFVLGMKQIVGRRLTLQATDWESGGYTAWLKGAKITQRQGRGKRNGPRFSRTRFEATPEFAEFKEGMKKLLAVPKAVLDAKVKAAKETSPRVGNPNAAGRKRKSNDESS